MDWAFQRALDRTPDRRGAAHPDGPVRARTWRSSAARPPTPQRLIHVGEAPVPADLKPADLAAMTTVARAILNLHETITRN